MRYYCTDIFESCHKRLKRHLITSSNHKDVLNTISKGAAAQFSFDLSYNCLFSKEWKFTDSKLLGDLYIISELSDFYTSGSEIYSASSAKISSVCYKVGRYFYHSKKRDIFYFCKILNVYHSESTPVVEFDYHNFLFCKLSNSFCHLNRYDSPSEFMEPSLTTHIDIVEPYIVNDKLFILPNYKYF